MPFFIIFIIISIITILLLLVHCNIFLPFLEPVRGIYCIKLLISTSQTGKRSPKLKQS